MVEPKSGVFKIIPMIFIWLGVGMFFGEKINEIFIYKDDDDKEIRAAMKNNSLM